MHDGGREGSLISILDKTETAMGGRLLKKWISSPLKKLDLILKRQQSVEELLSRIFEPNDDYFDQNKRRLRKAYYLAERLLYLLQDAYSARQAGILSEAEYEGWLTYLDKIGFNPLFFSALRFSHSNGSLMKDFANHTKERLLRSDRNKQAVGILYPELLQKDWINKLGKK